MTSDASGTPRAVLPWAGRDVTRVEFDWAVGLLLSGRGPGARPVASFRGLGNVPARPRTQSGTGTTRSGRLTVRQGWRAMARQPCLAPLSRGA